MKILLICTEKLPVPPIRGGAIQTYISGVINLIKQGNDLTVLGTTDPSLAEDEIVDSVRYVRKQGGLLETYMKGVTDFLINHSNEFDIIHIFNRPRLVLPVREVCPNAKLVLSMHNDMFLPEKINPDEAKKAIQELSQIITISNYVGDTIAASFPEVESKRTTIYSGVDLDRFVPPESPLAKQMRREIREQYDLQGKKVILFAGRLSANKGADILVRAMPELAKKHSDIALVIVGSKWFSQNDISDYIAYVRALAARLPIPVINTGFISHSEIHRWFAAADVFVCPSQWQEPLARVHYEAMASGLPIVTTARGGNPEVIIPNENGIVIEQPEQPESFVEPLAKILSDNGLRDKMSKKGRELATNHYTWERVAQDIKAVWDTVQQLPSPSTQSLEIENDLENETLEANEPTEQVNQDDLNMSSNEAAIEAIHDDDQQTEQPNLQEILTLSSNHEDDNATIHEDEKQTKQPNLQDNLALSSNHKEDNATIHEDEKQTNQSIIEGNLVSPPNNEDYVTIREDKQKTEQQVQKLLNKLKLEKNEELESFVKQHLFQKNELNEYLVTLYQESRSEDKMQEVKVFVEKLTKNVLSLLEMKLKQATEKKVSYTYDANNVSNLKIFTQK